jgi:hypothetical protein
MSRGAAVVLTLMVGIAAQSQSRQPWELTPGEHAKALRDAIERNMKPGDSVVEVSGQKDVAAFFPVELFTHVVRFYVAHKPPSGMAAHVRSADLFRDDRDWAKFVSLTEEYADVLRRMEYGTDDEKKGAAAKLRQAEASAFRSVRRHFGQERVDRFLYTFVGPNFGITFTKPPDEQRIRSVIAREEAGQ